MLPAGNFLLAHSDTFAVGCSL